MENVTDKKLVWEAFEQLKKRRGNYNGFEEDFIERAVIGHLTCLLEDFGDDSLNDLTKRLRRHEKFLGGKIWGHEK